LALQEFKNRYFNFIYIIFYKINVSILISEIIFRKNEFLKLKITFSGFPLIDVIFTNTFIRWVADILSFTGVLALYFIYIFTGKHNRQREESY